MFTSLLGHFINWISADIVLTLLVAMIGAGAMAQALNQAKTGSLPKKARALTGPVFGIIVLLGVIGLFRPVLNTNMNNFLATHGSLTDANLQSAQTIWGRPHIQRELAVAHFYDKPVQTAVPQADPNKPPLYKTDLVRTQAPENSVIGFSGQFDMTLNNREKGYALYSGFILKAHMIYQVVNTFDQATEADFTFPLSPDQRLVQGFQVLFDGKDISSLLQFGNDAVTWIMTMQPGQQSQLEIDYQTRGMDYFYYQMPTQHEIENFYLTLTIDRLPVSLLNYPDGVLSPTDIIPTSDGLGSMLTWKLDHALTTAGMGVALPQPDQPGAQVTSVIDNATQSFTLLLLLLALTFLIVGGALRPIDVALLAGIYSVQFLLMAGISDMLSGFWTTFGISVGLELLLAVILFWRYPSPLIRVLTLTLIVFFATIYPLIGLVNDASQANAFDSLFKASMILYLFGLVIYTHRKTEKRNALV